MQVNISNKNLKKKIGLGGYLGTFFRIPRNFCSHLVYEFFFISSAYSFILMLNKIISIDLFYCILVYKKKMRKQLKFKT